MARSSAATGMQPGSGPGAASTQLEFSQAMNDFRVMFPDMEADVIEAVLRANNGAVDATIDHLLAMTADNENEKTKGAPVGKDTPPAYPQNPPSYQQATQDGEEDLINLGGDDDQASKKAMAESLDPLDFLSDLSANGGASGGAAAAGGATAAAPSSPKHAYSHPKRQENERSSFADSSSGAAAAVSSSQSLVPTQQMLQDRYEENLRLREEARVNPEQAAARAQYLEDERLALMMQNEEFMAELRNDREFMSALAAEDEFDGAAGYDPAYAGAVGGSAAAPAGSSKKSSMRGKSLMMDEAMFREKLKNMSKTSKRKFTQLANMFSRRKGAKQLLGHAPAPSKDNLLLNAEPLINQEFEESEDDEDDRQKKTPTKGKYTSFS